MARVAGGEAVYEAAEHWVNAALRRDDSLFTPGEPIWSLENLTDFHERFAGQPDNSKDTFLNKFERQLDGAPSQIYQLAAEVLYLNYLIVYPRTISGDKKRENLNRVLHWSETPVAIPDHLIGAQDSGFVNPGPAFGVSLPAHIQLIAEFLQHWKSLPAGTHEQKLDDPWEFKKELDSIDVPRSVAQSMALLHLAYPEVFEPILSENHKNRIRESFGGVIKTHSDDVDLDLLNLRRNLNRTYGVDYHYYSPDLRTVWDPRLSEWERFIGWARRFAEHSQFDRWERYYKEEIASNIGEARSALISGKDEWIQALRDAFNSPNNLTNWREHTPFLDWCEKSPEAAAEALRAIWSDQSDLDSAIRNFLSQVPEDSPSGKNTRAKIAAFLAMAIDPYGNPPFRVTTYQAAYKLTRYPLPTSDADEADVYRHALGFLDKVLIEASNYGLKLRDRLDAQSVLWSLTTERFDDVLPDAEHDAFKRYLAQIPPPDGTDEDGESELVLPSESLDDLAKRLLWHPAHLRDIQRLLLDKRQIVFYGPPGTGKTFVAQELARHFAGAEGSIDLVQFHPSYAYEDFVEGFRPADRNGQPGFQLREGPLKRIADKARANPDATHVLVIDEINRGNVARVFGELYFLLEYRDREISLQYSEKQFSLPKTLWIIATMNTADRSIALVDAALRRRFHFVEFSPHEQPVRNLLRKWLTEKKPDMLWVADLVDLANRKLPDRQIAIGPSYFMHKNIDEEWLGLIWKHSIIPTVEEQLFGQTEQIAAFDLARLRAELQPQDPDANDGAPDDSDAAPGSD